MKNLLKQLKVLTPSAILRWRTIDARANRGFNRKVTCLPIVSVVLAVDGNNTTTGDDVNELRHIFAGQVLSNAVTAEDCRKRLGIEIEATELSISMRIENTTLCILRGWEMLIFGRDHESCLRTMSIVYSRIRQSFPQTSIIGLDVHDEKRSRLRRFMEKILVPLIVAFEGLIGSLASVYASYVSPELAIGLPLGFGISTSVLLALYYARRT